MRKRLVDIDLLRVLCVFLLISYHSFAIYSYMWQRPMGISDIKTYYWIGKLCYSFMLPLWVFISGYLWSYQINGLGKNLSFRSLMSKKTIKLLLPCYTFGILYVLLIGEINDLTTPKGLFFYLSGSGHLWFLPMLMWTFVFSFLIQKIKVNDTIILLALFVLSIISWNIASLGIGGALYYLFYFQFGFVCFKHKTDIGVFLNNWKYLIILIILFIILFPITTLGLENISSEINGFNERCLNQIQNHLLSAPCQILGILISLGIAMKLQTYFVNSKIIETLAIYSFGIYIVHQFILMGLYYHTNLPVKTGSVSLPWFALFTTIIASLIIVNLSIRTKIGRKLFL